MFGNTIQYYGGPGTVRRGLIWQSSPDIQPPAPPIETAFLKLTDIYGGFPYGSVISVYYNDNGDPPFYNEWKHDENMTISSVRYDSAHSCFRFDWSEWDTKDNTPTDVKNLSNFKIYPDVVERSPDPPWTFTKGINWYYKDDKGILRTLPYPHPFFSAYGETITSGYIELVWADDNWAERGIPFSWFGNFPDPGFMRASFDHFLMKNCVLHGVSGQKFRVRNATKENGEENFRYYNYRLVESAELTTERTSGKYSGTYIFKFHNLVILDDVIEYV